MNFCSIFVFISLLVLSKNQKIDPWDVRCHVCKAIVQEIEENITQIDPKKTINVSGFRLDSQGNSISKTVPYSKSELYLTELMETICDKMSNYAKVIHKKTGKLAVLKFMVDGQMNPDITDYEFVQDGDLNKSLELYCNEILEDHEDSFLKIFMDEKLNDNIDVEICSTKANYCKHESIAEDYNLETDEYHEEL